VIKSGNVRSQRYVLWNHQATVTISDKVIGHSQAGRGISEFIKKSLGKWWQELEFVHKIRVRKGDDFVNEMLRSKEGFLKFRKAVGWIIVRSTRETIGSVRFARDMFNNEPITSEVFGPSSLAAGQLFRSHKGFQSLAVSVDLDYVGWTFEMFTPFIKRIHNGKKFLVRCRIVPFSWSKGTRIEGNRVPLTIKLLSKDAGKGEAGGVGL
jgi:hypothetical protein